MTDIRSDVIEEAHRLCDLAGEQGLPLRLLGGVAIRLRAGEDCPPPLERGYEDLDWATKRGASDRVQKFLTAAGYTSQLRFNALYGRERLKFVDEANDRHLDIFVGKFRMSHEIPLEDRIELDERTLPLADLLLTKLQIAELNEKDVTDTFMLVGSHDVGTSSEAIDGGYVAQTCASDWGLWRTITGNLETCRERLPGSGLDDDLVEAIGSRIATLEEMLEAEPKSRKWKLRAKVGERKRWYELPEEVGV